LAVSVEHREGPPEPRLLALQARHPVRECDRVRLAERRDRRRCQTARIFELLHPRRGELLVARVRTLIVGVVLSLRSWGVIPQRRTPPHRESNQESSGDDDRAHRPQILARYVISETYIKLP